jgi:hypothetical protein
VIHNNPENKAKIKSNVPIFNVLLKKNHRSVQADSEDVKIEGLTLLFSLI